MGTRGTDPYRDFFLIHRKKIEKSGFFKKKLKKDYMYVHFKKFTVGMVGRELPGPVRSELPSGSWEESFPVGRDLPSGKRASWWEEGLPVGRELPGGKGASRWEGSF